MGADLYATVLADHHRIVRDGLSRFGGTERDTQGDAFFATFESPSGCVDAATFVQRAMEEHAWAHGEPLRVRMGIHTGEATETPTGLVGEDVHRAARIAGVANGGQVVLSESAAAMVRDALSHGAVLRSLGAHRLKDLGRPHELFQLVADGLRTGFPPLRSLDNPELPNNLPYRSSSFVGRSRELSDVRSLVEAHRLVTLAGAGGSGKTRLALEIAAQLLEANRGGVFFVDLANVGEPGEVPASIQVALGLPGRPGAGGLESLLEVLKTQQTLIVLDNCEHVVDECAKVAELIEQRSRAVRILATSREPLGIEGERVYRLGPLSLPRDDASSLADLASSDAIELFVERIRSHDAGFLPDDSMAAVLASICRRLDGVPFALELAAARLGSMSLVDLHQRLDQRFRLLTSGSRTALPRQRTLQATVDWSYDLLVAGERGVLDLLSVFVGSFDLAAAEALCARTVSGTTETADALASLVDKSLLASERSAADLRYRLTETIRQYAADKLALGGEGAVADARAAHAAHYLALAERAAPALRGGAEQASWMKRLDLEWANLRAAADHFDAGGDAVSVVRLCAALYRWYASRGNDELIPHLRRALERDAELDPELRARGLLAGSSIPGSGAPSDEELVAAMELADTGIEVAQRVHDRRVLAELLILRAGYAWALQADDWETRSRAAVAAAAESGDPGLIGMSIMHEVPFAGAGETRATRGLEALRYLQEAGDLLAVAAQFSGLSHERLVAGDVTSALDYAREAVRTTREIGARLDFEGNLAVCALLHGDLDEAERAARSSLVATYRTGAAKGSMNFSLWVLACCATQRGDVERAVKLTAAHDALNAQLTETSSHSFTWTPLEQQARDENHRRLRALLGGEFEGLYQQGQAMSLDATMDLALGRRSAA